MTDIYMECRKVGYSVLHPAWPYLDKHGLMFTAGLEFLPKMPDKECYRNAFWTAMENQDLFYCEGFAMIPGLFPMEHAWLVDKDGVVYDPTWHEPGTEYFGVCFTTPFIQLVAEKTRKYGILRIPKELETDEALNPLIHKEKVLC